MIRTKNIASTIDDVPDEWVFENYLNIGESLTGQEVWMKSIFNKSDKNPSMHVYMLQDGKKYRFKDFSTGKGGDKLDLVREIIRLEKDLQDLPTAREATIILIDEYNTFLCNGGDFAKRESKGEIKYRVLSHQIRKWNTLDAKYWKQYSIGSSLLEKYGVQPLEGYKMHKPGDPFEQEISIEGDNIYGYFRKDGALYKIYRPKLKRGKFIKVRDYIQGTDQLTMNQPYLVICSSLKDIMALASVRFSNVEAVAPDGEGILIPEPVIQSYIHKYKVVCTMLDNDKTGIESMQKYSEKYGLPYAHLQAGKDIAEVVRTHGISQSRDLIKDVLAPVLHKK